MAPPRAGSGHARGRASAARVTGYGLARAEPVPSRTVRGGVRTAGRRRRRSLRAVLSVPLAGQAQVAPGECGPPDPGVKCGPGKGRQTAGGGDKAPHNDGAGRNWPRITGILWQVVDSGDRRSSAVRSTTSCSAITATNACRAPAATTSCGATGTRRTTRPSSATTSAAAPATTGCTPATAATRSSAGPGVDYVYAYYGKGTIDCGPGRDTARVRIGTGAVPGEELRAHQALLCVRRDAFGRLQEAWRRRAARRSGSTPARSPAAAPGQGAAAARTR